MSNERITDGMDKDRNRGTPSTPWKLLGQYLSVLFGEIIENDELLSECYCAITAGARYDEEFLVSVATGIPGALICDGALAPDAFLKKNLPKLSIKQPVLITNKIGTGKSTFVHHFFRVSLKDLGLQDMVEGIFINLKRFGEGTDVPFERLEMFVHEKIEAYLNQFHPEHSSPALDSIEKLFKVELTPFRGLLAHLRSNQDDTAYADFVLTKADSWISDKKVFNRARLAHAKKGEGKRIFLIVDNVDHFGLPTQEKIFSLSIKLMNDLQVGVIMCARDYTVHRTFRHMPLAAFEPLFLNLSLPDTRGILEKRFEHLKNQEYIDNVFTLANEKSITLNSPSGVKLTYTKKEFEKEFNLMVSALMTNNKIINTLEKLSTNNMRTMLSMVCGALSSGHLFPEERELAGEVRFQDFMKAIMCGDNPYYYPEDSFVLNVFDNNQAAERGNNLIRLRTLQAVRNYGDKALVADVRTLLDNIGYKDYDVTKVLQLFLDHDLVDVPYHEGNDILRDDIKMVRLTLAGHYYLNDLILDINYLQEIKNATYLEKATVREISRHLAEGKSASSKGQRIAARLEATRVFIEAIKQIENEEEGAIIRSGNKDGLIEYNRLGKVSEEIALNFETSANRILTSLNIRIDS